MDVTLGPWTAEKTVDKAQRAAVTEAMGDEAWHTVEKTEGFTPKKAVNGKPAKSGFTISGRLTSVEKSGATTKVAAMFTIWVDGTFSNVAPLDGRGGAEGSSSASDAMRAITESRVKRLLEAIQAGRVAKVS